MPIRPAAAFLFDMDGTLLHSAASAERVWGAWAARHGIDVAPFLATMHGRRAIDTILRQKLPGTDAAREADWIIAAEMEDVGDIHAVDGATAFLRSLPAGRWAVATSTPRTLAVRRMEVAGLPVPGILITADDVQVGKPAPDVYLAAAERLGVAATRCVVFEDTTPGIESAEAAGAEVVVLATHPQRLDTPHVSIPNYLRISADLHDDLLRLVIRA